MLNLNGIYEVAPRPRRAATVGAEWLEKEIREQAGIRKRDRELFAILLLIAFQAFPFILAAVLLGGCTVIVPAPGRSNAFEAFVEHCSVHNPTYICYERAHSLGLGVRVSR